MTAEIVWRNPLPPAKDRGSVERISSNDCAVVYTVFEFDAHREFELIPGGAAWRHYQFARSS
jgi:hypothetical protein